MPWIWIAVAVALIALACTPRRWHDRLRDRYEQRRYAERRAARAGDVSRASLADTGPAAPGYWARRVHAAMRSREAR